MPICHDHNTVLILMINEIHIAVTNKDYPLGLEEMLKECAKMAVFHALG